jgi:hypothetical protein
VGRQLVGRQLVGRQLVGRQLVGRQLVDFLSLIEHSRMVLLIEKQSTSRVNYKL